MQKKLSVFFKNLPIVLAAIASVGVIYWEGSNNGGQGGCLSMIILFGWVFAGFISSGD